MRAYFFFFFFHSLRVRGQAKVFCIFVYTPTHPFTHPCKPVVRRARRDPLFVLTCCFQPDPAVFTGADKRVLSAKESEAYLALAFQGSSWTDEHAFPLMIMQTIMGGWDRSSGE